MTESRRLSCVQAADFLGLSKRTLDRWRTTGAGPHHYAVGRRVVYDTNDLSAWLQAHKRRSTSETIPA